MGNFPFDKVPRHDANHLSPGLKRRIGNAAHQPNLAAAINELQLMMRNRAPRRFRRVQKHRVIPRCRAAKNANCL